MSARDSQSRGIDRRTLLQGIGGITAFGVAGCLGDDDDTGNGDIEGGGERVPTLTFEIQSGIGSTPNFETTAETLQRNLDELGVELTLDTVDHSTQIENITNDQRTCELTMWGHPDSPDRLDPQEMIRRWSIDWAGGNGQPNTPNWANCEYTHWATMQQGELDIEQRQEYVNEAVSVMGEELPLIPVIPYVARGAVRADRIGYDDDLIGSMGMTPYNYVFMCEADVLEGDQLVVAETSTTAETANFPVLTNSPSQAFWNFLVHSPLITYDQHHELTNVLASGYDESEDGTELVVELRDDATFHNGDPVTAEDVVFTFEQLSGSPGAYPLADTPPFESIEAIDDLTTEFVMEEPYAPFLTREIPKWGIFHKETWEDGGAPEDPEGFDFDPIVGSGPFSITDFNQGQSIAAEPHDGHPIFTPGHNIYYEMYEDATTAVQAFLAGEVDAIILDLGTGDFETIENELGDDAGLIVSEGGQGENIYPQCNFAPTMFQEFRAAIAAALNRQEIVDIVGAGQFEPNLYASPFTEHHPWTPPTDELVQVVDDPTGNIDAAREYLSDAGWDWDDDGNLHYPEDADLDALWPEGETPSPDEFDCLTEDGGFDTEYTP